MAKSLRSDIIPSGVVILWPNSGTLPNDYTHVSTLYNKFPKQVPNSCTNPGTCRGADSHADPSGSFCHGHSGNAISHNHSDGTGTANQTLNKNCFGGGTGAARASHTHVGNTSSSCTTVTPANNTFTHSHTAQCIIPPYITSRYIKKGTVVHLRKRNPIQCSIIMWNNNISCVPSNWIIHCSYNGCFIRGVTNGCTAPGTTGGTSSHQHASAAAAHTHTQSISNHGHTHSNPPQHVHCRQANQGGSAVIGTHCHTTNTLAITNASGAISNTSGATSHQHGSSNNNPQHHEIAYIRTTNIKMRESGIPNKGIVLWDCTLSSIPAGLLLADGTSCTPNILGRYAKGIPNNCTNPGTQSGCVNHQHSSVTHTHNTSPTAHTHTSTGTSGAATIVTNSDPGGTSGQTLATNTHTHSASSPTGPNSQTHNPGSGGGHQHTAVNNCPSSKDFAFIQRRIQ